MCHIKSVNADNRRLPIYYLNYIIIIIIITLLNPGPYIKFRCAKYFRGSYTNVSMNPL